MTLTWFQQLTTSWRQKRKLHAVDAIHALAISVDRYVTYEDPGALFVKVKFTAANKLTKSIRGTNINSSSEVCPYNYISFVIVFLCSASNSN